MKDKITFTGEEMHALLDYVSQKTNDKKIEPNTFTTMEWAEHFDISEKTARRHIKVLIGDGVVESAGRLDRKSVHGVWIRVEGYRYLNGIEEVI